MTKIVVNGREVEADPKKPLIAACHGADVEVPHYCYHPGLTPVGSCRICQVEVQQGDTPPRVVVACRTPVAEGMVVNTESEKAHATRRECLEFLLKNHPLDCPICDKAGECDLQDYTYQEGQSAGRSLEPRRKLEKRKSLGDTIVLDEERCILCSRCVRFFEEVTKKPQLTVSDRGAHSMISTFMDKPLRGKYQGNIADLCPVGALTLKPFRFEARVWNLKKYSSTCGECSRGCAISVETLRAGEVKRFRPRFDADVNGYWMCDIGRFAFGHANPPERVTTARTRGYHGLEDMGVDAALDIVVDMLATHPGARVVASPFVTVEEGRLLLELARALGGDDAKPMFVSPAPNAEQDDLLHTGDPCPNRRGLTELGFEAVEADALVQRLGEFDVSVLVGERVAELIGAERLASLPARTRLAVFDVAPVDARAVAVQIGVPLAVERSGHWINVDGVKRPISPARPMPQGVRLTTRLLKDLIARVPAANASTERAGAPLR